MKLTRQELVNLVKEEMAHPRGDLGVNIADVEFPILVGYEGKSEIAYNRDELDNILDDIAPRGIPYSLDALADVEVQDLPTGVGIEMMEKVIITKSKLSEMIKRTVRKTIKEQVVGYEAPSGAEESEQDDYLTTGQTSIAAAPHSQEEEQAADTSTRELTQQRQQQLDKDDAVTADDTGRQLQDLLNQKNEGKMRITKKQLRQIIRESLLEQAGPEQPRANAAPAGDAPPSDVQDAIARGKSRAGRPDLVVQDIKAWQAAGSTEDIIGAYLAGYHWGQTDIDLWYDDVEGYYPGKIADDIADQFSITIPKIGDIT